MAARHLVAEPSDRAMKPAGSSTGSRPSRAASRRWFIADRGSTAGAFAAVVHQAERLGLHPGRGRGPSPSSAQSPLASRPIATPNHLVHRAEAEPRHVLANVLGDEAEVVFDELRLSGEQLPQLGGAAWRRTPPLWVTRASSRTRTRRAQPWRSRSPSTSGAAMTTSRPGLQLAVDLDGDPRSRRFSRASGRGPRLPGDAALCLMAVTGDAPVPPSCPEISTTSACAFATPAAMVPTPTAATSLTLSTRARIADSGRR